MLRFSDFAHLPQIDGLVRELVSEPRGLIVVAVLDSRPALEGPGDSRPSFLPSGRATIFRVLVSELLDAHPGRRCVVVGEDRGVLHVARRFKSRLEFIAVKPPLTYDQALRGLSGPRPGVVVIDRLTAENLPAILAVAHTGALVVSQVDTLYAGDDLVRYLHDLGATAADLSSLRWVLSVQRLPTLCPICRQPAAVSADQMAQLEALGRRYPDLTAVHAPGDGGAFYAPGRCATCQATGRQGDAAVFDFFHVPAGVEPAARHSRLPMGAYVWMLAQRGQLALSDALDFDGDQLRRAHALLMATTRTASDLGAALERKTAELDTANRLLKQRMRELVSLEGIGQALITWSDLSELGARVVRVAVELCKADRRALLHPFSRLGAGAGRPRLAGGGDRPGFGPRPRLQWRIGARGDALPRPAAGHHRGRRRASDGGRAGCAAGGPRHSRRDDAHPVHPPGAILPGRGSLAANVGRLCRLGHAAGRTAGTIAEQSRGVGSRPGEYSPEGAVGTRAGTGPA
ncbi:MAG TPA: hypothetical protein PLH39_09015, partial [Promineifilum sp.]|nr:hypothetical protein [Promineifilum sp.]